TCALNGSQLLDPIAVGAGIGVGAGSGIAGTQGAVVVENCILWGNVGTDTFRTKLANGGPTGRKLGQEIQISPMPNWTGATDCLFVRGGSVVFNNSCVEKLGVEVHFNGSIGGLANIGVDPILANQDLGNLHLSDPSPCIDTGNRLIDADIVRGGF